MINIFEKPTPLTNWLIVVSILILLTWVFGELITNNIGILLLKILRSVLSTVHLILLIIILNKY